MSLWDSGGGPGRGSAGRVWNLVAAPVLHQLRGVLEATWAPGQTCSGLASPGSVCIAVLQQMAGALGLCQNSPARKVRGPSTRHQDPTALGVGSGVPPQAAPRTWTLLVSISRSQGSCGVNVPQPRREWRRGLPLWGKGSLRDGGPREEDRGWLWLQ